MFKKTALIISLLFIVIGFAPAVGATKPTDNNKPGQEVCPDGNGWTKEDNLSGYTYTFNIEVPQGFTIETCYKAGTDVVKSEGSTTVDSTSTGHELSHASYRLVQDDTSDDDGGDDDTTDPGDGTEDPGDVLGVSDETEDPADPAVPADPASDENGEVLGEQVVAPVGSVNAGVGASSFTTILGLIGSAMLIGLGLSSVFKNER